MKKIQFLMILALLCTVVQGAWAQTEVSSENALKNAITNDANVKLMADIALSEKLTISSGKTVTIDLNGKKLSRSLSANENYGMVIYVNGGNLTIKDGSGDNSGQITGGRSYNGAGVLCESGSTLTINGGTFKDNDVSRHEGDHGRGGAIFMNPNTTLTITGGVFDGNSAYNGGAIYIDDGGPDNGTPASATISGAEFKNCWVTGDGGAIYNKGTLTISNCNISGNRATGNGGGIYSISSFSMSGNPVITGNTVNDGANNLYLRNSDVINCGAFTTGAKIGLTLENNNRVFTNGYSTNGNASTDPSTIFLADTDSPVTILLGPSGEVWQVKGADASFDFAGSGTEVDPYLIGTSTDWQMMALLVNEGGEYATKYYRLTHDIDTKDMMVGTEQAPFRGTFEGDNHTLSFNYTSETELAAPFNRVGGATIRHLHTQGSINTEAQYSGGIVGRVLGGGSTHLYNCHSSVNIGATTSGDKSWGGLVGAVVTSTDTLFIERCSFTGALTTTVSGTTNVGGFVGWSNGPVCITEGLFDPGSYKYVTGNVGFSFIKSGATFARMSDYGKLKLKDCYTAYHFGDIKQGAFVIGDIQMLFECTYEFIGEPDVTIDGKNYYKNGCWVRLTAPDNVGFNHWVDYLGGAFISDPWTRDGIHQLKDVDEPMQLGYDTNAIPTAITQRTLWGVTYRYLSRRDYHYYISDEDMAAKGYTFRNDNNNANMVVYDSKNKESLVTAVTGYDENDYNSDGVQIHNDLVGDLRDHTHLGLIAPHAFRNSTKLTSLYFKDTDANNYNALLDFDFFIDQGAFEGCTQFKELKMMQYTTEGTNHWEALEPTQVTYVADDAFSGCTNLKISTRTDKYQDYLSSATWKEHRSRFIIYEATVEDFEVEGVKYHKYRYVENEREAVKNDEAGKADMINRIISWNGDYHNFSAAELLETEDDCNVYYTYVMGVDDSKIDDRGGTMRIYNDPGSYYNYKTIALGRKAIAGNTHVKSIEFWQTNGRSKNSYSDLKMVIPNGALKGCTNLEEIRLYYYAEDGEDRWMQLGPKDVIPGDNIFGLATAEELLEMSEEEQAEQDALRPRNLKILVATELYSDFKNDPNWQPYLAYLEPEDYSPTAKSDFTKDGLTYGYISSPGGIMQTSQVVSQDVSWWTAPRIAIEVAMAAASIYSFASSQSVLESTQVAYSEAMDKAIKKGEDYVGQQAVVKAAETNAAAIASATQQNLGEIVTSIMGSKITSLEGAVSKTVIEQLAEWGVVNTKGMITATTAEAIGNLTTGQFALAQTAFFQYARQKLAEATTKLVECEVLWKSAQKAWSTIAVKRAVAAKATYVLQGIKALPYAVNPVATATSTAGLIASKCWGGSGSYNADAMNKGMRENILSNIHQVGLVGGGYIITTPQKNLVYHTYVKEVGNDVTNAVIYAGKKEGTNESTRTTTFAKKAFQNKTNLQTVKFHENTDNTSNTSMSLCLTIPDSAFVGCTNLREFSTLLQTEENGTQALGPENFTLAGDSIFAGMKSEAEVDSLTKIGEGEGLVAFHIIIDPLRKQDYLENDSWSPLQRFFKYEEAKPAVKFTEYGAKYAYAYENNSIKKENKINGHLIEHTIVVGPDDDFIKGHQGAVKLCNDIGTYNNYQLDEVKAGAFRGNKNVRSVSFTDLKGFLLTGDVYSDLEVSIGDSAFVDCTNLADLDLLYMVTDGSNHLDPMTPSQISIGEGVFDRTNARLKMMPQQVAWFEADSTWATYKDRFMPCVIPLADPGIKSALEDMAYYDPANTGTDQAYWKGYVDLARIGGAGFSWLDGRFTAQKDKIYSFADFRWFASVELDYVGASWFEDCSKLGNITLPSTIKTIQSKAFKGCSSLQEIELPQGVTSIGDNAFAGCSKLNTILVRDSVPATIGTGVFDKHSGLQIYVPAPRVDDYKSKWSEYASYIVGDNDYTFSKVVTVTAPGQLASKLGLTLMKESYVVRYINGPYAKYDSLTVKGPLNGDDIAVLRYLAGANSYDSKQTDGQTKYLNLWDASITEDINVFHGKWDENLKADKVPNYMFESCKMIEKVIFPQSVTGINKSIFQDASAMKRICVGRNTKEYGKNILKNVNGIEELVFLTNQFCSSTSDDPWSASIENVYALKSQVGDYLGDYKLTKRANNTTAPFKEDAAMWALADKGHFFPSEYFAMESVDGIFEDHTDITTLEDFDQFSNVKTLQTTFRNMTHLETINLPTCIENIGAEAFAGCSALMEIHLGCDSVPTLAEDAFKDLPADFTIYVPKRLCKLYRATWEQYADHINPENSNSADDEIITVTLTEKNTLAEKLGLTMTLGDYSSGAKYVNGVRGDYSHIKKLKVIGPISGGDFDVMNYLAGYCSWELDRNYSGHLEYIDLYDAEIQKTNVKVVGYKRNVQSLYLSEDFTLFNVDDNVMPKFGFLRAYSLKTLILPKTCKEVRERALQECEALETLVVGDDCEDFDWSALDDDAMLSRMFILAKKKMGIDSGNAIWNLLCNNYNPTFDAFYVRPSLYEEYLKDDAYTGSSWQRTNNISKGAFEEDASFVAFAAHAAATEDDLAEVYSVNGWFDSHPDVLDLTPLGYAAIDELRAVDIQKLTKLEKVTLPATLTTLEEGVFSQSPNLRYADMLMCDEELTTTVKTRGLAALGIDSLRTLVFVPTYFGTTEGTNIVVSDDSGLHTKTFRMLDDKDYCVPYNFKTAKVVNTRRIIGQGKPYTLFLPYELTFDPSVAKVYKPTDRDGSTVTFEQVADGKVEALKPYVIRPTGRQVSLNTDDERSIPASSGYLGSLSENQWQVPGYTMRGTLSRIDNKDAAERQLMMLAGDTWVTVPADNENAYIAPFRTYILQSGNSGNVRELTMTFWDSDPTSIDTIRTIDLDGTERYYDLNGRELPGKPEKGAYIHNGKKYIKK